jgi:hypothetical protein
MKNALDFEAINPRRWRPSPNRITVGVATSRDATALRGHNKRLSSHIPRQSAGFKVAQSENFGSKLTMGDCV